MIEYSFTKEMPLDALAALYAHEGWLEPDEDASSLEPMIRNSFACVGAFDDGKLVGFMRAFSDGVSDAYLLDLVVDPAYRRMGIGREIVSRLAGRLRELGAEWILCIGAPGTESFYAAVGGQVMEGYAPIRFSGARFSRLGQGK